MTFNFRRIKWPSITEKGSMTEVEEKNVLSGQGKVLFLGNRSDVDRLYQAMDVFILPSRYEGLPVVGVEAQAAGLPCIFSDRITEETKMTDEVFFLDFDYKIERWVKTVQNSINHRRDNQTEYIQQAGFSIEQKSRQLLDYYKNTIKTEG